MVLLDTCKSPPAPPFLMLLLYLFMQMRACKRPRMKGRFVKSGVQSNIGGHPIELEAEEEDDIEEASGAADADVEASEENEEV